MVVVPWVGSAICGFASCGGVLTLWGIKRGWVLSPITLSTTLLISAGTLGLVFGAWNLYAELVPWAGTT